MTRLELLADSLARGTATGTATGTAGQPPLAFIDDEPFLIELQGSLELPGGLVTDGIDMGGTLVGKLDTSEPNKPILQIAHHRLEGKLVTLVEPFALLRTTPPPAQTSHDNAESAPPALTPRIDILALIRRKIVFSRRPEPIITLSSDAPDVEME